MNLKQIWTLSFLMLFCSLVRGQTNFTFDVLETKQGTYTNAHFGTITPAWVTVLHDSGGAKVYITNLPPEIQKQLGYDPAKAASQAQVEIDRQKLAAAVAAERRQQIAARAADAQTIQIISIQDKFGLCTIQTEAGVIQAYLIGIPLGSEKYLKDVASLKANIERTSKSINHQREYTMKDMKLSDLKDRLTEMQTEGEAVTKIKATIPSRPVKQIFELE